MVSALALSLLLASSGAAAPRAPALPEVLGAVAHHVVKADESLIEIARQYDLGFLEIAAANPGVDAYVPDVGATVTIPTSFIVPRAVRPGAVVVNVSEMRLYYLPNGRGAPLMTFPIGTAYKDEGYATPIGSWRVVAKEANPVWYPPQSVREEHPDMPRTVPPGPDNPLGSHALKLSAPGILIHGTNKPYGVGREVSRGCIRLYPEDIPQLFGVVPVGTEVDIVREPLKVGVRDGRVFLEVHADDAAPRVAEDALVLLARRKLLDRADQEKVRAAFAAKLGLPVDVTR